MDNLNVNIIESSQYIDGYTPTLPFYDAKKNAFKDKLASDYFASGCKNLKEFSLICGVDVKKLTSWVYNG